VSGLARRLGLPEDRPIRCLALGAHADDLEIGAGGSLLRLLDERPDTEIDWVVLSAVDERADEAVRSATALTAGSAGVRVHVLDGRDSYLPYENPAGLKDRLASIVGPAPDLVLAHRRDDAHQDHRFASDLAWQLCRGAVILEYEIPKWDGDLGTANLYVPLTADQADRKVAHLLEAFPSQAGRSWYSEETFRAILRLRGIECRAPDGAAEAFVARKIVV
jgi:LmbE family N-acetylglucosaminyl deacetylase